MLSGPLTSTWSIIVISIFLLLLVLRSSSRNRTRRPVLSSSSADATLLHDEEEAIPMSDEDLKNAMIPEDMVEEEMTQVAEAGRVRRERRRMRAQRDDDSDT